jgi:hypothetical protein
MGIAGYWDNDGDTMIGVYRNARFYLRNSNTDGFVDTVLDLGIPGDMPIAGNQVIGMASRKNTQEKFCNQTGWKQELSAGLCLM